MQSLTQLELLTAFPATDRRGQINRFGSDQALEPPDTQVAAGPDSVVEAVNSSMTVWSKGGQLVGAFDLNSLFQLQSGLSFGDPRVLYDPLTGRWFLSGFALAGSSSESLVAVSVTADPGARWTIYSTAVASVLYDQPKLGVSSDKVVIAWNDYSCLTCSFAGQETMVLQKSDLLVAANSLRSWSFGPDLNRFSPVPTIEQSPSSDEFVAYNGRSFVGVAKISGTPAAGNVSWTEADFPIGATAIPPVAAQAGSATLIMTNDDRFLSAAWKDGQLWVGGNDACTPTGDSVLRSCLRLVQLSATDASASLLQEFDVGDPGAYLYYPAVTLDAAENLFFTYSASAASLEPSLIAASLVIGAASLTGGLVFQGAGPYDYSVCHYPNRWGDYSGAAIDPANGHDVWLAGEYAASATDTCDWGTGIARLTLAPPAVSSLNPSSGRSPGGTPITITGSEFAPGVTQVAFGGALVPADGVTVDSPTQLRVYSPSASCGAAAVTVTTPNGSAVVTTPFTYVGAPCPAPPTPGAFRTRISAPPETAGQATSLRTSRSTGAGAAFMAGVHLGSAFTSSVRSAPPRSPGPFRPF